MKIKNEGENESVTTQIEQTKKIKMINLLQTNIRGSANTSVANNNNNNNTTNTKNTSHFLSQNLQQNGNLKSDKFEKTMKIEEISSGDQIAFIKIQDELSSSSSSPIKPSKFQHRTQFQKFFMQFYSDFFRQYCMCMHKKVEPDDLVSVHNHTHNDDHYNDKYAANSFLLSHTSIIPITVVPKKYEYVTFCVCFFLLLLYLFCSLLPQKK